MLVPASSTIFFKEMIKDSDLKTIAEQYFRNQILVRSNLAVCSLVSCLSELPILDTDNPSLTFFNKNEYLETEKPSKLILTIESSNYENVANKKISVARIVYLTHVINCILHNKIENINFTGGLSKMFQETSSALPKLYLGDELIPEGHILKFAECRSKRLTNQLFLIQVSLWGGDTYNSGDEHRFSPYMWRLHKLFEKHEIKIIYKPLEPRDSSLMNLAGNENNMCDWLEQIIALLHDAVYTRSPTIFFEDICLFLNSHQWRILREGLESRKLNEILYCLTFWIDGKYVDMENFPIN